MVTEDYVNFETAKLLKEKGFNEKCRALYTFWFDEVEGPKEDDAENWNIEPKYFSAPTLQMAMKWLRESHNLYIVAMPNNIGEEVFYPAIYKKFGLGWDLVNFFKNAEYHTPESACESAIKYCLENLI